MPPDPNAFAAELISQGASAIAGGAASAMADRDPSLAERWGEGAFAYWKADLTDRVAYLIAAVRAGRPELFASQVRWSALAFRSREVPITDLRVAIESLGECACDAMPPLALPPVKASIGAALAVLDGPITDRPMGRSFDPEHAELSQRYMLALLEGDRDRASRLILQAVDAGLGVPEVYRKVLGPVQQELGEMWMAGDIHIGTEHFSTETTRHVMSQLFPIITRTPKRDGRVALASSVEGNQHDIGIRMVADLLEMDGWRPIYLGASVPAADLVETAVDFNVDVVVLSAMLALHIDAARDAIAAFRAHEQTKDIPIIVGGPAFADAPGLWAELGADGFTERAGDISEVAERLVANLG